MGFQEAGDDLVEDMAAGLDAFAEMIMSSSLEQCPIETGTLRRSAKIVTAHPGRSFEGFSRLRNSSGQFMGIGSPVKEVTTILGYGFGDEINPKTHRPASEYAVPVHERVEAYHKPPTKSKFLEDPVYEHAAAMEPMLAAYMREDSAASYVLGAVLGGVTDIKEVGAGLPPSALDAGDHPKGTPHT